MGNQWIRIAGFVVAAAGLAGGCDAQSLPSTEGETLGGHRVVVAQAVRGHTAVLIAGFSKDAGDGSSAWSKAVHGDPVLQGALVYQLVMLERAPSLIRPMIKSGMRKGMSAREQEECVILTADEKLCDRGGRSSGLARAWDGAGAGAAAEAGGAVEPGRGSECRGGRIETWRRAGFDQELG